MTDLRNAVLNEEYFVANVMAFLQRIGSGLETITDPSGAELSAIAFVNSLGAANTKLTFASIRTAKNNHRIVSGKLAKNNPNNQRLLNFYIDADNPDVSAIDYGKLRSFAANNLLAASGEDPVRTILSVGIPRGLLNSSSDASKDLIKIRVHRLNSRQEDLVYQPRDFVFDMSLFPTGFSSATDEFVSCTDISETRIDNIRTVSDLVRVDPYYLTRQPLAMEVLRNVTNSYLLRTYINMLTGINVDDSSMRDINSSVVDIKEGFKKLSSDGLAQIQTVIEEIQPRTYLGFLDVLQSFFGDTMAQGLILPLTRNVADFVFASRLYDRVFSVVVAPSDFAAITPRALSNREPGIVNSSTGVVIDQYFVEVVTR